MCFIQVGSLDKQKANIDEISFDEIKNIEFYNGSINIVKTDNSQINIDTKIDKFIKQGELWLAENSLSLQDSSTFCEISQMSSFSTFILDKDRHILTEINHDRNGLNFYQMRTEVFDWVLKNKEKLEDKEYCSGTDVSCLKGMSDEILDNATTKIFLKEKNCKKQ